MDHTVFRLLRKASKISLSPLSRMSDPGPPRELLPNLLLNSSIELTRLCETGWMFGHTQTSFAPATVQSSSPPSLYSLAFSHSLSVGLEFSSKIVAFLPSLDYFAFLMSPGYVHSAAVSFDLSTGVGVVPLLCNCIYKWNNSAAMLGRIFTYDSSVLAEHSFIKDLAGSLPFFF